MMAYIVTPLTPPDTFGSLAVMMSEDSKGPSKADEVVDLEMSNLEKRLERERSNLEKQLEREPPTLLTLLHLVDSIAKDESLHSPESVAALVHQRISSRDQNLKSVPIYFSVHPRRSVCRESSTDESALVSLSSSISSSFPSISDALVRIESVEGVTPRFHRILRSVSDINHAKEDAFFYFLARNSVAPDSSGADASFDSGNLKGSTIYIFASPLDSDLKPVSTSIFPVLFPSAATAVASIRDAFKRARSSAASSTPPLKFRGTPTSTPVLSISASTSTKVGDRDSGQFSTPTTSTPFCSIENIAESTTESPISALPPLSSDPLPPPTTETPHVQLRQNPNKRTKAPAPFFQRFSSVIDYHSSSSRVSNLATTPSPGQRRRRSIDFGAKSSAAKASRCSDRPPTGEGVKEASPENEDDDSKSCQRRLSIPSSKREQDRPPSYQALSMPAKLTTITPTKTISTDFLNNGDLDASPSQRKNVSADPAFVKSLDVSLSSLDGDSSSRPPNRIEDASPSSILGEEDSFAKYVASRMRNAVSPGTSEDASFVTLQDTRSPENGDGGDTILESKKTQQQQRSTTAPQHKEQQQKQQKTPPLDTKADSKPRTSSQSRAKDALKKRRSSEVGRVASWATKFEKLLCDEWGRDLFKQFLRQEYSEENMRFWEAVEDFRLLTNKSTIKKTSKKIYEDFLAEDALDSVNVDAKVRVSVVESLKNGATVATFTAAQQQILG